MNAMLCCPRCGRQNESRARFCASCGLNLAAAGIEPNSHIQRTTRRTGAWLVLSLVLLGLGLATFATCFRIVRCQPPIRPVPIPPRLIPPAVYEQYEEHDQREGEIIFYHRRESERELPYQRRDRSPRIPTH
jgi:hypothetical protein